MTALKYMVAALCFVAALLVDHQNANAASRSYKLEARLPTAVPVFCTDNTNLNYALLAEHEIYLAAPTCDSLLNTEPSLDGRGGVSWASYAHVLYHEWWHVTFQERNEQRTECGAFAVYRYMLTTFWGFSKARAQVFYRATTVYSPYAPLGCAL